MGYFDLFYYFLPFLLQIKLFFEYFTYALSLMNFAKCFLLQIERSKDGTFDMDPPFLVVFVCFSYVHILLGFFRKNSEHSLNSFSRS
jgi:hypothetical protein